VFLIEPFKPAGFVFVDDEPGDGDSLATLFAAE
jgi:hypothetical protein